MLLFEEPIHSGTFGIPREDTYPLLQEVVARAKAACHQTPFSNHRSTMGPRLHVTFILGCSLQLHVRASVGQWSRRKNDYTLYTRDFKPALPLRKDKIPKEQSRRKATADELMT